MRPKKPTPKYGRILLKLSGEALGAGGLGIDPSVLDRTALEIGQLVGIWCDISCWQIAQPVRVGASEWIWIQIDINPSKLFCKSPR